MSTDIDWIVEQETLPANEHPSPEPAPPQRPPRRLWLALALVVITAGIILYLWSLGGLEHLEATVQLEITALRNRDQEVFTQLQDDPTRRSNFQPAPHGWFATGGELADDVEMVELQLLDASAALAEIRLTWDGVPYRLFWFYRRVNEHWVHTDWQKADLGPEERLISNQVEITYNQVFQDQAKALADQVDDYLRALCDVLTCPTYPLTVSLELDPHYRYYNADEIHQVGPAEEESLVLHYRLPAPLQIRWPWDHQPEPLVLGSLGRALARELLVQDFPSDLAPENKAAVTLSAFWLAHRLLDLESPPTTCWLEEAVEKNGLAAFVAFFSALQEGIPPSEALVGSFQPESVKSIRSQLDFFGWRAEVLNPIHQVKPQLRLLSPGPISTPYNPAIWRNRDLQMRFDWEVDPWAPDGRVFKRAVPNIVDLVYQDGWATASAPVDADWAAAFFFRKDNGDWLPTDLKEISMTQQIDTTDGHSSVTDGPLTVTYWSWDEPYITETLETLHLVYRDLTSDFDLGEDLPYTFAVVPFDDTEGTVFAPEPDAIQILSRTSPEWYRMDDDQTYQTSLVSETVYRMLAKKHPGPSGEGWFFLGGLISWETEQILSELGYESVLSIWLPAWTPPAAPMEDERIRLESLWDKGGNNLSQSRVLNLSLVAAAVVDYIVAEHGPETLPMMLNALESAGSTDEWVAAVTGRSLDEFEADWRSWVIETGPSGQ